MAKLEDEGCVIIKGLIEQEVVTFPPESDEQFLKSLLDLIAVETEGVCICGGDFNLITDHDLDTAST